MKKYLRFILLHSFILSSLFSFAQYTDTISEKKETAQADISHSFFNSIASNPAYTGIFNGHNIQINTELEKPLFDTRYLFSPLQYNISYDVALGKKCSNAIGLFYSRIKAGNYVDSTYGISYARSISLGRNKNFYHHLRLGISFIYSTTLYDWDKLYMNDNIDPKYGFIWNTSEIRSDTLRSFASFHLGAWYQNPVFYFGFTGKNLSRPEQSFYGSDLMPIEYDIATGGNISITDYLSLHPSVNACIVQGFKGSLTTISPAVIGSYKNKCFLGVSYKDLNKITFHAGFTAIKRITLSAACGLSTNTDLNVFGYPSYIGGDLRVNLKNKK